MPARGTVEPAPRLSAVSPYGSAVLLLLAATGVAGGLTPLALDEFLTGERTLRSDVLDRLASVLGYVLQPKE